MKNNLALSLISTVLVIFGATAHASCADVHATVLFEGMEENQCLDGSSPTTKGRLEMVVDSSKAMDELKEAIEDTYNNNLRPLYNPMRAALIAKKNYSGTVEIAQLVWQCGSKSWGKQLVFVGKNCEQVGRTFNYYKENLPSQNY